MSERKRPPLPPGSAPTGALRAAVGNGQNQTAGRAVGGAAGGRGGGAGGADGRDAAGGSRGWQVQTAYVPPLEGRLSSASLLEPVSYKSLGSSVGSTPRDGESSRTRRPSEDILDEIERLCAQPSKGPGGGGPLSLQIGTLGPRVLSQQTGATAGDALGSSRASSVMGGSVAGSMAGGRGTERPLKVVLQSRHRSESPARRGALDEDRSVAVRSQPSFPDSVSASSFAPPEPQPRPATRARTAGSTAESDMDAHLPPERNPWTVLEKLRLRPERSEFRYMMAYKRDAFTPVNPYHLQVPPHLLYARSLLHFWSPM